MFGIQKFDEKMKHEALLKARNRMYRRALKLGEDISIFDAMECVRKDGYFKWLDAKTALALSCEIYQSCGFCLPYKYNIAIIEMQAGNGNKFVELALDAF